MSEYAPKIGDVVKLSNRKDAVLYTVTWTPESVGMASELADPEIQSHNTGRLSRKAATALILVESHPEVSENVIVQDERTSTEREADEQAAKSREDEPVTEQTSYQKTILRALNVLGKHVYQGTAKNRPARKARKLAKAARRATRKAK